MNQPVLTTEERHQHWTLSKPAVRTPNGGNAVDATVVIALALHVVGPWSSSLGGGGFLVIDLGPRGLGAVNFPMKSAENVSADNYPLADVPGRNGLFQ